MKVASRRSKNTKQNCTKWNSDMNLASYNPQLKQGQGYFRTENQKQPNLFANSKTPRNASSGITKSKNYGRICSASENKQSRVDSCGARKGFSSAFQKNYQNTCDFENRLDRCVETRDGKVERLLDQGLSRFEMISPQILETRINEQDDQIAYLEEEGTSLRERLNKMEKGIGSLKLRMRTLEVANAFRSTEILSGEASFA